MALSLLFLLFSAPLLGELANLLGLPEADLISLSAAAAVTVALHELCHIVAARLFGVRTRLGVGRAGPCPMIYVSLLSPIRVGNLLKITLAPLVTVTAALVLAGLALSSLSPRVTLVSLMAVSFNTAAAAGDVVAYAVLRSAPRNAIVEDRGAYIEVRAEEWRPEVPEILKCSTVLTRAVLVSLVLAIVASALVGGELGIAVAGHRLVLARVSVVSLEDGGFEVIIGVEPVFVLLLSGFALLYLLASSALRRRLSAPARPRA